MKKLKSEYHMHDQPTVTENDFSGSWPVSRSLMLLLWAMQLLWACYPSQRELWEKNLGFPSQSPCLTDGTRRFSNTLKKAWPHKAWGTQFFVIHLVSFASLCCLPGREANTGVLFPGFWQTSSSSFAVSYFENRKMNMSHFSKPLTPLVT